MKNLSKQKSHFGWLLTLFFIILLFLSWFVLMKLITFSNNHYIQKNRILSMTWKWPLEIKQKEETKVIIKEVLPEYPGEIDTPIKKYICDKFGVYDCKIALGIVEAESKFNAEAWNINSNGTIDIGLWQINSIHFSKEGCSIRDALDPIRATDCAFSIWKSNGGWNPWVTFKNGSYLAKLE